jgi:hypothetical protein
MSTPVVHGRTTSPGGGETQTATPRILAAELEQRRRKDPGKADWGEEQRPGAEVEATGHREPRDDGGVLVDDDEARIEEEHREARIAMNAAILQMPWLWGRAAVPTTGNWTEEQQQALRSWTAEQQQALTEARRAQGEPEPQEQPLDDGHNLNAEVEEMEVDVPLVQQKQPRTTNTSWAVGSNIALQHRYLVQEAYDAQRRYSPGEEVAFITGQLRHQYRIAEMNHGTSGIEDAALSDSRLELKHGSGQLLTWEQHGRIRQLYTQCSRRPGEVIGPRDMIHIRSHRSRTSMYFVGDVVAVPFIWQTGQQGFRYAKVCWKDALIEASTKGLYQLDGGVHNPNMLRARGSFYAIDRNSPTREWLEEEDILEVPGRRGARLQDEWVGPSPGQELEPWSTPTSTDL